LSEIKLTTNEIREWLEEETRSILTPVQNQAKQLRDEMGSALQTEAEASKMLLDNSNREIERRNMRVFLKRSPMIFLKSSLRTHNAFS
jgi:hypothetical protein